MFYSASGRYVYYATMSKETYPGDKRVTQKIMRYDLLKKKTKMISSGAKLYFVGKITSKYVYHRSESQYYRYTISSKKETKLSWSAYRKACGY